MTSLSGTRLRLIVLAILSMAALIPPHAGAITAMGRCNETCEHRYDECMDNVNRGDGMELQEKGGECRDIKIACINDCSIDVPDTTRKPKVQEPAPSQERPVEKQAPQSELKQVSSDDPNKCRVFAGFEGCEETHSCICLK